MGDLVPMPRRSNRVLIKPALSVDTRRAIVITHLLREIGHFRFCTYTHMHTLEAPEVRKLGCIGTIFAEVEGVLCESFVHSYIKLDETVGGCCIDALNLVAREVTFIFGSFTGYISGYEAGTRFQKIWSRLQK